MAKEIRLIDANALYESALDLYRKGDLCDECASEILNLIDDAHTVDAVPVVHGRWIDRTKNVLGYYDYRYDCSVCEHIFWSGGIESFNYCPNCGAKMDGDGNG